MKLYEDGKLTKVLKNEGLTSNKEIAADYGEPTEINLTSAEGPLSADEVSVQMTSVPLQALHL